MGRDHSRMVGEDTPEDPADLLPEDSLLSLDEYLDIQKAIGNRTRFEIVYRLVHDRNMTAMDPSECSSPD